MARRWHLREFFAICLLAWASFSSAQTNVVGTPQYALKIQRLSLIDAIRQFSIQTDLQLAVDLNDPAERALLVGPVIGEYTADGALQTLLDGSDLEFEWQNGHTIRVFSRKGSVATKTDREVEEMLVTGTRIATFGEGPAPVRVIGQKQIERYGVSTLPELTKFFTQQPFAHDEGYRTSGAQYIQMRGLGVDTTLVLINGRRTAASGNSVSVNAFDLNTVPLTAIDRIEVLSDSASAIYGADAIGGVVNIILKRDARPPEVYLHYGSANDGADERRIALSGGYANGRLRVNAVADHFERSPLFGFDRDLWRDQDYRRFGGQDFRLSTASPGTVYSLTRSPLPGLSSTFAAIPEGDGVGLTPQDLVATAGKINLDSSFEYITAVPRTERTSAFASADFSILPGMALFGELLVTENDVVSSRGLPALSHALVPGVNPYNPFDVDVAIDYRFVGMRPVELDTKSNLFRTVFGIKGGLSRWDWEVAAQTNYTESNSRRLNEIDPMRVGAALSATDPMLALNVFGSGPASNPALLNSLVHAPIQIREASSNEQLSAFVRGPIPSIFSREGELVVGGEWRHESVKFFDSASVSPERTISAVFAEVKFPLVDSLTLSLAARGDHYVGVDQTINPQYGLVWKPSRELLLRASYGTSFRPPSLFELYSPRREFSSTVTDLRRGGSTSPVLLLVGGNPNLDVVTADSFTTGFVLTPDIVPDLKVAGSYWSVRMNNRIAVPPAVQLLAAEFSLPGRVIRSAPTAGDIALGYPGAVQTMDITRLNFGWLETSGIDLDLSYSKRGKFGRLESTLMGTWVQEYVTKNLPMTPAADSVDLAFAPGTIPRWKVVGAVSWSVEEAGMSLNATYIPEYDDTNLTGRTGRELPSRTIVDLQGWWSFGNGGRHADLLSDVTATLGIQNLFDKAPDFAEAGIIAGYDLSQADMRQRFVYLRLSKKF